MSSTTSLMAAELLGGAPMTFEQRFQVGWSHLDANAHMRNTAYLDLAVGVRVTYFAAAGYFRELRLQDDVRVTLLLAGSSEDASRFRRSLQPLETSCQHRLPAV